MHMLVGSACLYTGSAYFCAYTGSIFKGGMPVYKQAHHIHIS